MVARVTYISTFFTSVKPPQIFQHTSTHSCCSGGGGGCDLVQAMYVFVELIGLKLFSQILGHCNPVGVYIYMTNKRRVIICQVRVVTTCEMIH